MILGNKASDLESIFKMKGNVVRSIQLRLRDRIRKKLLQCGITTF